MRFPCDLIVGNNTKKSTKKSTMIAFEDRVADWALNTLGYIPTVCMVEGRIQIWFKTREDQLLYVVFVGPKDYIDITLN